MSQKPLSPPPERPTTCVEQSVGRPAEDNVVHNTSLDVCQWAHSPYRAWCAGTGLTAANDNNRPAGPISRDQAILILHYQRRYFEGIARRSVQEEAEDVVSDVIAWLLARDVTWTIERAGYLAIIVRGHAVDRYRKWARRRAHETYAEVECTDQSADPETSTSSRQELLIALTRMSGWAANDNHGEWGHERAKARAAVLANVLDEHERTSREIAAALGLSDSRIRHLQMELRAAVRGQPSSRR